ncbi:hypothetical protein [Prauserella rugosa]|uniref:Uncharacterized protein n=1 Tax=Prauserella rugosa TaxID=43354 RepID=A0A660CHL3_9PSEU|nr:hypothetical protein [Prauserella rugosa]TWH21133.1 hypothetical protein JD82_02987 [Prauserella rugosa]
MFIFIGAFPGLLGLRNGYSGPRRRRPQQAAALEELLRKHSGSALPIDWMRFADLPKQHIQDVLAPAGWRYSHEDVGNGAWWLVFTYSPHTPYTGPAERLTRELSAIDGDAYKMNAVRYGALGIDEFRRVIQEAGWRTDYVRIVDGMSVERDLELTEMPRNPALAPLVNDYYNKHGYSPLDPERILHLRARKRYWARKSIGCLGLLVCLVCLVFGPLILALSMSDLARDSAEVITFSVGSGLTAIAVALIAYEIWTRNVRRGRDIGPHEKILKQLTKLHKETRSASRTDVDPSRHSR